MDKLIHTALNSMNAARLKQVTSAQNLSNAQVTGYQGDEIGGRFGSVYLHAQDQLDTRVFPQKSQPGLFSTKQGELRETGQQTDVAITGKGYFLIENQAGRLGMSRRGDLTMATDGSLLNGAGQSVLDTSLKPINVPPFRKIFISENGQIFIQPMGAEPGVKQLVNQIGMSSGDELDLIKDKDGIIRPAGGFVREQFNPDQNAKLQQGYVETSNISVFDELVNNVEIQKHYQLNVKLIGLAKELDEAGASLLKLPGG